MVGVNVRQKKVVEITAPRRLHLPQEIGGNPFPRPHVRVGFLRRRNLERVLGGSRIDEHRRRIRAENERGIAAAIRQMVDVQRPRLPRLKNRLRYLRADNPGIPEFRKGGRPQKCSSVHHSSTPSLFHRSVNP
jgi:hypothetical protein